MGIAGCNEIIPDMVRLSGGFPHSVGFIQPTKLNEAIAQLMTAIIALHEAFPKYYPQLQASDETPWPPNDFWTDPESRYGYTEDSQHESAMQSIVRILERVVVDDKDFSDIWGEFLNEKSGIASESDPQSHAGELSEIVSACGW